MNDKHTAAHLICGINPVTEALKTGDKVVSVHISKQRQVNIDEILRLARERGVGIKFEEKNFFDARFSKGHQGVAASVKAKKKITIEELLELPDRKGEAAFFMVLDCIEDPRNFGALLRVADAAGMHGVVFQSHRSAGITETVSKSSAGALEHSNLVEIVNIKHAIEKMKKKDITIIGAEADSDLSMWDINMKGPLAVVVGSEGHGLRRTVKDMCDNIISLPMLGKVNSLNVSVAAGIIAYEALRQRRK
ncbi:MAG: 23S rRNA (guanosine(2251)-2'-O)-methyltransferase RlmB [Nitrospirae bacterium]|nr:MAG: 23S rRNA (guanosine(2251)-2'-O)-methyltransferase RlmB [Nitrospirota bacterium]